MKAIVQNDTRQASYTFLLCLLTLSFGLALLLAPALSPVQAAGTTRYVRVYSTSGDAGDCTSPQSPCATIQYAVDQANAGDLIAIYGYESFYKYRYYTQTQQRAAPPGYLGPSQVKQVVYIDKSLTLRGGYNYDFSIWDPVKYKTVIQPGINGYEGRAIFVAPGASPTLEYLYIFKGNGAGQGGVDSLWPDTGNGIFADGRSGGTDTLIVRNCTFADNTGSVYRGGGLFVHYRTNVIISDNVFRTGDTVWNGAGASVYNSTNVTIQNNQFYDNSTGGAIYLEQTDGASITSNQVYSNTNRGYGGGIEAREVNNVDIANNDIHHNTAFLLAGRDARGGELIFKPLETCRFATTECTATPASREEAASLRFTVAASR